MYVSIRKQKGQRKMCYQLTNQTQWLQKVLGEWLDKSKMIKKVQKTVASCIHGKYKQDCP